MYSCIVLDGGASTRTNKIRSDMKVVGTEEAIRWRRLLLHIYKMKKSPFEEAENIFGLQKGVLYIRTYLLVWII